MSDTPTTNEGPKHPPRVYPPYEPPRLVPLGNLRDLLALKSGKAVDTSPPHQLNSRNN
jgi:hypothetical protein